MQYKGFLLGLTMVGSSVCSFGQQDLQQIGATKVVGRDTIALPKDYKPKDPAIAALIAANTPVTAPKGPQPRKKVPMAGQKDYFGEMNDYVNKYVRQYLVAHNKTLSVVQTRSNDHFALMENILKQHDIPRELIYLSVIESALNNTALSRVGARGPWQLMAGTAAMMGITATKKKDERIDWYKSTTAAAKYLSLLYNKLDDWLLVVAAYNSGPGPVLRAINRTGSTNFWDIKKYLPRETQGHVLAFIATTSIFEKHSDLIGAHIPNDMDINAPKKLAVAKNEPKPKYSQEELERMAVVRMKDPVSFDFMAAELGIDKRILEKWNDDYELFLMGNYPDPVYNLRFPKEKLESFLEKKSFIVNRSKKILDELPA